MLDSETKSRIDSARDILVGKVPDPKSQVEQITIALIYKFMDDMDRQSEELGGKATFFSGEYKKYAWSRLLDNRLGGHERLLLYAEGIEKMNENKKIPQLFRDIFKGVFLPYRDPETLNLFLKEINGFSYDHSERLGDAFEYLLSVMDSQGSAGQFRTPRHIIDFIVQIVDPRKNETILDPACGTAGFLISSYKHTLAQNTKDRPGDQLTADERGRLMTNFCGYDISPDMVRLSRVNMYLHGFANPRIHEYDTLTSEERWDERYDVILANPPFMTPKGGIRPHNRFSIKAKRSEVLFVDYIAEHLNVNGRAGIIVPEGIIFQSQNAYKKLRKMLVENYLWCVVSLPAGCFNPYSGVKTSVLFLDKSLVKRTDEILFVKVENDGFDLGAQRRVIEKNNLPEALRAILDFRLQISDLKKVGFSTNQKSKSENQKFLAAHTVPKSKILSSGDINLSGDRYRDTALRASTNWPMVNLGEVAAISAGDSAPQDDKYFSNGTIPFFRTSDVGAVHISANLRQSNDLLNDEAVNELRLTIWPPKTILFPKSGASTFLNHRVMLGCSGCVSSHLATISPDIQKALPEFLFNLLCQVDAKTLTEDQNYPSLRLGDLGRIEIPLPPLEVQEKIVAELDDYRKIIEGAKQIITNYKSAVRIDPNWPTVELRTVCERIMDGTHFSPKNSNEGQYLYITAKNIKECRLDLSDVTHVNETDHKEIYKRCPVLKGDVLYIKDGATAGIATINTLDEQFSLLSSVAVLRGSPHKLDNKYLCHYLNSPQGKSHMLSLIDGVAITRLTLAKLNSALIPLPPLSVQLEIVAEIEAERQLVEANRKLIEVFERKIQAKLAEIWGEE